VWQLPVYPAGHVIGSAQIRVEYKGEVWVVSGDYKTEDDGISTPFEPVKCHHFISECTFGMPVYQWKPQVQIFDEVNNWWRNNVQQRRGNGYCRLLAWARHSAFFKTLICQSAKFIPMA
jgi:hypothetical protein